MSTPPSVRPPPLPSPATAPAGDATGGLIPYKNPKALTAYYLGIFSLLPVLGVLMGIIAIFLGMAGLKFQGANPQVRGVVHAWIGIIAGGLSILIQGAIVALIVFGATR